MPQRSAPCSSPDHLVTHPESLEAPTRTHSPTSPAPHPPRLQSKWSGPFPSPPTPTPTLRHSPAIVGFHPDLVGMVPAAAACDRVRHGTAVPLGRHLLTPPPQRGRPRVRGARRAPWGDSATRVSSRGAAAACLPVHSARGADPRVASPGQPEPRGSSRRPGPARLPARVPPT